MLRHDRHRLGLRGEITAFGLAGAVAYVADVGVFNVLVVTLLAHHALLAKSISTAVGVVVSYVLNREITWRHRGRTRRVLHEFALYVVISVTGLALNLSVLAFSEYALDERSLLARNISANVVGMGVAMVWRFLAYRRWVFVPEPPQSYRRDVELAPATSGAAGSLPR